MKKGKALAALLLSFSLLFSTACGGKTNTSSAANTSTKGRYEQTDITPEGENGQLFLFEQENNKLVCFNQNFSKQHTSTDGGKTWETTDGPGSKTTELGMVFATALLPDGSIVANVPLSNEVTENADNGMPKSKIIKVEKDGTVTDITPTEFLTHQEEYNDLYVSNLVAVDTDTYALAYSYSMEGNPSGADTAAEENPVESTEEVTEETTVTSTENIDESADEPEDGMNFGMQYGANCGIFSASTKEKVTSLPGENTSSIFANKQNLFLVDYMNNIHVLQKDGTKVKEIENPFNFDMATFFPFFYANNGDEIFSATPKEITMLEKDGTTKTILDGSSYAFGNPQTYISNLYETGDKTFVVSVDSTEQTKLYRYEYNPDAVFDASKALRIWSLEDSTILRTAINQYSQKHTDTQITYETGKNEESGQSAEDAIRTLNTQILAGEGPDLILLDNMPIERYINKGLLADISKSIDTSNVYEPLKNAFKTEKGTFAYATRFTLPLLVGKQESIAPVKTFDDAIQFATSGPEVPKVDFENNGIPENLPNEQLPNLIFGSSEELFKLLWNSSYSSVIQGNTLDKANLNKFLTSYKEIADKNNLNQPDSFNPTGIMMSSLAGGGDTTLIEGSASGYIMGSAKATAFTASDLFAIAQMYSLSNTTIQNLAGINGNSWQPVAILGVNAKTKVQPLAEDFINFVLSDEAQAIRSSKGFSVNKTGTLKQMEEIQKTLDESNTPNFSIDFSFDIEPLIQNLAEPCLPDAQLYQLFFENSEQYVQNKQSLEETITTIEQQLQNYLAERQ